MAIKSRNLFKWQPDPNAKASQYELNGTPFIIETKKIKRDEEEIIVGVVNNGQMNIHPGDYLTSVGSTLIAIASKGLEDPESLSAKFSPESILQVAAAVSHLNSGAASTLAMCAVLWHNLLPDSEHVVTADASNS